MKYYQISKISIASFRQFPGRDHTILINEYQRNYDVIMPFLRIVWSWADNWPKAYNNMNILHVVEFLLNYLDDNDNAYFIGGKKVREKRISFSQVTNIFPRLNFSPIWFNLTFPTFFKTRQKTLPISLTLPHLLPSNFKVHEGKIFLQKIFS